MNENFKIGIIGLGYVGLPLAIEFTNAQYNVTGIDIDESKVDLINSGKKTGELLWRMPIDEKYMKMINSKVADIKNIGGRYGGAITAAAFLAHFTKDEKWAHLDIAGTAWEVGPDKGSTGRPVKLLTDFVISNK